MKRTIKILNKTILDLIWCVTSALKVDMKLLVTIKYKMTNNYKKLLFIILFILFQTVVFNLASAQSSNNDNQKAKVAAKTFYKKYLPIFGYPDESGLRELRPYLSRNLYTLIGNERKRMKLWSAKNPDEKPPVIEDLFLCNHYEPATKFRFGKASSSGRATLVTIYFDYLENGKVYDTCQTKSSFIQRNGKWLLDNIFFEKGVDLKTLLSRKEYTVLPE